MISGEEEARLIYQGVAHTTGGADQRLVVDIGGASTELVTGTGAQTTSLFSLSMGCVTWLERYFADRNLGQENFDAAEKAAREVLRPVADELRYHGWKVCVGASGTVQALQEIMMAQGMDERITLEKMGGAFFLSVLIPFFLSSLLRIRLMEHWMALIVLPFEVAFLSDAFALFAGMLFGKHKLAPHLSPKIPDYF